MLLLFLEHKHNDSSVIIIPALLDVFGRVSGGFIIWNGFMPAINSNKCRSKGWAQEHLFFGGFVKRSVREKRSPGELELFQIKTVRSQGSSSLWCWDSTIMILVRLERKHHDSCVA